MTDRVFPEAKSIAMEDNRAQLSKKDWDRFCSKLDEPPKDLPELRKLLKEPSIFKQTNGIEVADAW